MDNVQSSGLIGETVNAQTLIYKGRGLFCGMEGNAVGAAWLANVYDSAIAAASGTLLQQKHGNVDHDNIETNFTHPISFTNGLVVDLTNVDVVVYYIILP